MTCSWLFTLDMSVGENCVLVKNVTISGPRSLLTNLWKIEVDWQKLGLFEWFVCVKTSTSVITCSEAETTSQFLKHVTSVLADG